MKYDFNRAVEEGYWRGVARAFEDGMEVKGFLEGVEGEAETFLEMLTDAMRGRSETWHPRAVRMAAAYLTVGKIARINYPDQADEDTRPIDRDTIPGHLECLKNIKNSATHNDENGDEEDKPAE